MSKESNNQNTEFNKDLIGQKIITSRGRFGRIVDIKDRETIVVKMGSRLYDIFFNEVLLAKDVINIEVSFTDNITFTDDKRMFFLRKQLVVFDFSNPIENNAYNVCKEHLSKILGHSKFTIKLINIV